MALDRQADTSPVLLEMIRILSDEKVNPVDKAIAYAEGKRPALLAQVRGRHQRDRLALEPLLKAASLEQSRGQSRAARARFQELLDLEPDWPQALESYAWLLHDLSFQSLEHGPLQTALADAEHCHRLATQLHDQDQSKTEGQRVLSAACEQLGSVLVVRVREGDAERTMKLYERSLDLREDLLKRNPDSAQAARDLSVSLEKLGDFLAARRSRVTPNGAEVLRAGPGPHRRPVQTQPRLHTGGPRRLDQPRRARRLPRPARPAG